jgi:hypothetical protein
MQGVAHRASKREQAMRSGPAVCLACGGVTEAGLSFVGSLRCLDCRQVDAALSPRLVQQWQATVRQRAHRFWGPGSVALSLHQVLRRNTGASRDASAR